MIRFLELARAFFYEPDQVFLPPLHSCYAEPVAGHSDQAHRRCAQYVKPIGLVKMRLQIKLESSPLLVPDAVVVTRENSECVFSRWYVGVMNLPGLARLELPVVIKALEPVSEFYFLGRNEAEGREIECEFSTTGPEAHVMIRINFFVVDPHAL